MAFDGSPELLGPGWLVAVVEVTVEGDVTVDETLRTAGWADVQAEATTSKANAATILRLAIAASEMSITS